jgi:hypothetical protein
VAPAPVSCASEEPLLVDAAAAPPVELSFRALSAPVEHPATTIAAATANEKFLTVCSAGLGRAFHRPRHHRMFAGLGNVVRNVL